MIQLLVAIFYFSSTQPMIINKQYSFVRECEEEANILMTEYLKNSKVQRVEVSCAKIGGKAT